MKKLMGVINSKLLMCYQCTSVYTVHKHVYTVNTFTQISQVMFICVRTVLSEGHEGQSLKLKHNISLSVNHVFTTYF